MTCKVIYFGGTVLMQEMENKGWAPFFGPEDIAVYEAIYRSALSEEQKHSYTEMLLKQGAKAHETICRALASGDQTFTADSLLKGLGFEMGKRLSYDPIDSINFDVKQHYSELLDNVLRTIEEGHVPIVLGGTDSLRFYGTLLAEELQARNLSVPVLLVSSMRPFGKEGKENQDHVLRLFKAANNAASYAVKHQMKGVYALVPENVEAKTVHLISMQDTVDKISGTMVKAIVGTSVGEVSPEGISNEIGFEPCRIENEKSFYVKLISPPLENYNDFEAIYRYLAVLYKSKTPAFNAVIIKGIPELKEGGVKKLSSLIHALSTREIAVIFADDKTYNPATGQLESITPNFKNHPARAELEKVGGIFLDDTSSTRAYIKAAMGKIQKAAKSSGEYYHVLTAIPAPAKNLTQKSVLAFEYVPDQEAFTRGLELARNAGFKKILSSNFTHGAMAENYVGILSERFGDLDIALTFKYAGRNMGGGAEEAADLADYKPSKAMEQCKIITKGGSTRPEELYEQLCDKALSVAPAMYQVALQARQQSYNESVRS